MNVKQKLVESLTTSSTNMLKSLWTSGFWKVLIIQKCQNNGKRNHLCSTCAFSIISNAPIQSCKVGVSQCIDVCIDKANEETANLHAAPQEEDLGGGGSSRWFIHIARQPDRYRYNAYRVPWKLHQSLVPEQYEHLHTILYKMWRLLHIRSP